MCRKDKSTDSFRVWRRISILFNNIIHTNPSSDLQVGLECIKRTEINIACTHTHTPYEKSFLTAFQTSPLECLFLVFPLEREPVEPIRDRYNYVTRRRRCQLFYFYIFKRTKRHFRHKQHARIQLLLIIIVTLHMFEVWTRNIIIKILGIVYVIIRFKHRHNIGGCSFHARYVWVYYNIILL